MKYWKRWATQIIEDVAKINDWTPQELIEAIECDITWQEIGYQVQHLRNMAKKQSGGG